MRNCKNTKRGRPTNFRPEYISQAAVLREKFGAREDEIAQFFGANQRTFRDWTARSKAIGAAHKKPADDPQLALGSHLDECVERALRVALRTNGGRSAARKSTRISHDIAVALSAVLAACAAQLTGPASRSVGEI